MIGRALMALVCVLAVASASRAQGVDLELVLAVDSSGSIDDHEFALQRLGYARAVIKKLLQELNLAAAPPS